MRALAPLKNDRGMALLISLTVISLIVTLTLQFNKNMRLHLLASGIRKNSAQLEVMAKSGITIGMAVLVKDAKENEHDSLQDSWALLADEDLSPLFDTGSLTIKITDNSGKFPINSLVQTKAKQTENAPAPDKSPAQATAQEQEARNILWRLLRNEPFKLEDSVAHTIIDSLIDWLDAGDGDWEQEFGAESSYYQSLEKPYPCKNGPVEFVEELLLVQGITSELLYGTDKHPGLAPLLTTQGNDGLININTADPLILQALHEDLSKEMIEDILTFREDKKNKDKLASKTWPAELLPSLGGKNALKNVTVSSHSFTISAQAELDISQKNIVATVHRENLKTTLLSWKIE